MQVEHKYEANSTRDKSPELVSFVASDATAEIVSDRSMPSNECTASQYDNEAEEKPTPTKDVFHMP